MTKLGVQEEYKHSKMVHSSGGQVELDLYMEELKLAFEYQGVQHYKPVHAMCIDLATQNTRDREKREFCKEVQIFTNLICRMESR